MRKKTKIQRNDLLLVPLFTNLLGFDFFNWLIGKWLLAPVGLNRWMVKKSKTEDALQFNICIRMCCWRFYNRRIRCFSSKNYVWNFDLDHLIFTHFKKKSQKLKRNSYPNSLDHRMTLLQHHHFSLWLQLLIQMPSALQYLFLLKRYQHPVNQYILE